jgi:hypothetical protein
MSRHLAALTLVLLAPACAALQAGPIAIPNASFESPEVPLAYPVIDSWEQVPAWYAQQSGVFLNPLPTELHYIDNCDGSQGAFLFTSNNVAIFVDYDSTDWSNPTPTHAFDAAFDVGKSYTLTVGVIGGTNLTIPMQEGPVLVLGLYYRDGESNMVTVSTLSITNSDSLFGSGTHFMDFQVHVPTVQASDPWAGQHIGVQILSAVSPDLEGGYWDLDNVRLFAAGAPTLLAPVWTNGLFSFTLESEPGLRFEILASTDPSLPLSNWASLGTLTNTSGDTPFLDPAANYSHRFYRARQLP